MASYPASVPSFNTGLIPSEFKKEQSVATEVESICTQIGTVVATASTALSIATADSAKTIKVASGQTRTITNPLHAGTCAITISTTGATHGTMFHLIRTGSTGATGATIRVASHTFTASKAFGATLKYVGTAWYLVSSHQHV